MCLIFIFYLILYIYYIKNFLKNQIYERIIYIVNALALTGGADRTRTRHILGAKEVLFQMSYDPIKLYALC